MKSLNSMYCARRRQRVLERERAVLLSTGMVWKNCVMSRLTMKR